MITIKIHDKKWFKEHCRVVREIGYDRLLTPKYSPWKKVRTISWISGDCNSMSPLEGLILKVERYDAHGNDITDARYFAGGYWIPNWAIEWVKETE